MFLALTRFIRAVGLIFRSSVEHRKEKGTVIKSYILQNNAAVLCLLEVPHPEVPIPSPQTAPSTKNPLKSMTKLRTKYRVDNRIKRRIEITQP
jgi:hypothetical protein